MSPFIRRVGLLALVLGVIGGAVAAAAIPRTRAARAATVPSASAVRVAPARPQPTGASFVGLRRTGPLRTAVRVADPEGGDPWVVRTFLAERLNRPARRTLVIGRDRCFQLGRIHAGHFGWIDDHDVFRPVPTAYRGAPITCGSRRPDLHREPTIQAFHLLRSPSGTEPTRVRTVVWGAVGRAGRGLDLRLDGDPVRTTAGRDGAALSVTTADGDTSTLEGEARYPSGPPVPITGAQGLSDRFERGLRHQPEPDSPTFIAARAPDPNGGLPYGLAAREAQGGGQCVEQQPGRIVGGRVGRVDFGLGTFVEDRVDRSACQGIGYIGREHPLAIGYGGGDDGGQDPSADPTPGRVARRTLPGMQYFAGQAAPDVRSLTLSSPRDVRTLLPSSPAHAFLVVYDGTFDSGTMRFSARRADGTTYREDSPLGF